MTYQISVFLMVLGTVGTIIILWLLHKYMTGKLFQVLFGSVLLVYGVAFVLFAVRTGIALTTVVSEDRYTIISTGRIIRDQSIELTVEDENGVRATVVLGMPDYLKYHQDSKMKTYMPTLSELNPYGKKDCLVVVRYEAGNKKRILEGRPGGELAPVLAAYNLKLEVS